jgi:hypothetical protein
MNMRFSSVILLMVGVSWAAFAQSSTPMREGNWEMTMRINLPGLEGTPPLKQTQCLTAAMLKDPASAMPSGAPGADCKVSDYKVADNVATYKVACSQPVPLNATGELKYVGTDAYTGTISIDMSGQNMVVAIDAKRIGDCPK